MVGVACGHGLSSISCFFSISIEGVTVAMETSCEKGTKLGHFCLLLRDGGDNEKAFLWVRLVVTTYFVGGRDRERHTSSEGSSSSFVGVASGCSAPSISSDTPYIRIMIIITFGACILVSPWQLN